MTVAKRQADKDAATHASEEKGYVSSLRARPHDLIPPGAQRARLSELVAVVAWIVRSWLNPADAHAIRKQGSRREHREPRP
jgi:hypothetical protein